MKCTVDHIGIAVASLADALAFYRDELGLEIEAPEVVASQGVRAHFVVLDSAAPPPRGVTLELLEAAAADSPIAQVHREARARDPSHRPPSARSRRRA